MNFKKNIVFKYRIPLVSQTIVKCGYVGYININTCLLNYPPASTLCVSETCRSKYHLEDSGLLGCGAVSLG